MLISVISPNGTNALLTKHSIPETMFTVEQKEGFQFVDRVLAFKREFLVLFMVYVMYTNPHVRNWSLKTALKWVCFARINHIQFRSSLFSPPSPEASCSRLQLSPNSLPKRSDFFPPCHTTYPPTGRQPTRVAMATFRRVKWTSDPYREWKAACSSSTM